MRHKTRRLRNGLSRALFITIVTSSRQSRRDCIKCIQHELVAFIDYCFKMCVLSAGGISTGEFCVRPLVYDGNHGYMAHRLWNLEILNEVIRKNRVIILIIRAR